MPSGKTTKEVVSCITSLSQEKADAKRLLDLNKGHWSIENKSHYVRDVTFDEDRSRLRSGGLARILASLRNLAISILRLAGSENIAESLRECAWKVWPAFRLIGV